MLDVQYAQNWSVGRDLVILAKTIKAVIVAAGSY